MRERDSRLDLRTHIASGVLSPSASWIEQEQKARKEELPIVDQIELHLSYFDEKARGGLAEVLSKVDIKSLPDHIQQELMQTLQPISTVTDFSIKPTHSTGIGSGVPWTLCRSSETRLITAMNHHMVMGVTATAEETGEPEDVLAVKSIGRLAGLCLQSTVTPSGTMFVEGVWYAPTNPNVREHLKHDIDKGVGRILGDDVLEWVVQRECDGPSYNMIVPSLRSGIADFHEVPNVYQRRRLRAEIRDDYAGVAS